MMGLEVRYCTGWHKLNLEKKKFQSEWNFIKIQKANGHHHQKNSHPKRHHHQKVHTRNDSRISNDAKIKVDKYNDFMNDTLNSKPG